MNLIIKLAIAPTAVLLFGCGTPQSSGDCVGRSICPITIVERSAGGFVAHPDRITVRSKGTTTLLWTFEDPSKYEFRANTSHPNGDGVEFDESVNKDLRIKPCVITDESKKPVAHKGKGPYYRCEVRLDAPKFESKYRIRFHTKDGRQLMIDPTVVTTGSSDGGVKSNVEIVKVKVGDAIVLGPLPADKDGVRIVWDALEGGLFKSRQGDEVTFKDPNGVAFLNSGCYVATKDDGEEPDDATTLPEESRYYACYFGSGVAYDLVYNAKYHDGTNTVQERSNTLKRQP